MNNWARRGGNTKRRELIRRNNITDPDILAALAEELGYRARRTIWTEGEMRRYKRSAGLGGFAKALIKLKTRNKTPSEELIIEELGYIIRVRTKSESVLYIEAPIKRA